MSQPAGVAEHANGGPTTGLKERGGDHGVPRGVAARSDTHPAAVAGVEGQELRLGDAVAVEHPHHAAVGRVGPLPRHHARRQRHQRGGGVALQPRQPRREVQPLVHDPVQRRGGLVDLTQRDPIGRGRRHRAPADLPRRRQRPARRPRRRRATRRRPRHRAGPDLPGSLIHHSASRWMVSGSSSCSAAGTLASPRRASSWVRVASARWRVMG